MGVQGLWKLLESTGKPIPVEKLENKTLSIDISIWMYQIIKGVRENDNGTTNKHLIVMFHRICKLLFYGIKPIFVFDGSVPELKKLTIAQRQAQKSRAKKSTGKTKEKILKNMLEQAAIKTVLNSGNTPTEEEVISKTVKSLNKSTEVDLFELPKLPEIFELDKATDLKKEDQVYLSTSKKTTEHIMLLAVENQNNDFLYTNSAKDKEKASPAKLNEFSSLQIGDLLNGFTNDQNRLAERKKQQKSKREMTFNELEMFLKDDLEKNSSSNEFSQKIHSDHDTVFYYESNIDKTTKSSSSKNNDTQRSSSQSSEDVFETKSKNTNHKTIVPDTIGSPTLTEDIDEDIFKALAGDESLEEDRLAWLIFNENKKASKRRSSEFESPNIKCLKLDANEDGSNYSEVVTSGLNGEVSVKSNRSLSEEHCPKNILNSENVISNELNANNFDNKDDLSWESPSKDECGEKKSENRELTLDYQSIPSTSKSVPMIKDDLSINQSVGDKQDTIKSMYFESNIYKLKEYDECSNTSPSAGSDISNDPFSENSLDFSSEEDSLSYDVSKEALLLGVPRQAIIVQSSNNHLDNLTTTINETKSNLLNKQKLKSPTKINTKPIKQLELFDDQTNFMDKQYLLSLQDSLVKRQNDLAGVHRTTDRMASSVTQKIVSDIKILLRLFGIPYITAPMEAEAQCAFLERIGRTEGTVTDDSDVWLFGANIVYKDFFDSQKYVKQFKSIDIKQRFALSQNSFIQLAFLVGSDYTNGIDGIGPVTAIEILSFFESKTKNKNIEDKLLKIKDVANSKSEAYSDIPFMKKLRSTKIGSDFPNKAVINAYLNPIVNESNEKFKWGTPQEDLIIKYAQTNFDWDVSKTKSTLAPVLKKVSERTKQTSLDSFVKTLPKLSNTNTGMSKRVSLAVKRLRSDGNSSTAYCETSNSQPTPTSSKDRINKKRRNNLK